VRFPRATRLIACFQNEEDAWRFRVELTKRLAQFELEVEPAKTAALRFGSKAQANRKWDGLHCPKTFNFLGFTHYVGCSRSGRFVVGRRTEAKRFQKKLQMLNERLRNFACKAGRP